MSKIRELPLSSSRLLTSSQIISSIFSVVKELVENAIDSGAKNVEVKLEEFGLDKIEVKDNGYGVNKKDIEFVAKAHFTSKIVSFSDLENISSYGFRGEALSAICAVADFSLTTKSSEDSVGSLSSFSKDGQLLFSKPCPCVQGTTVSVLNLFKNLPVRRQYYRSEKNKKDELHKIEELLAAYGIIQNDIRFVLYHNKSIIWQKSALPTIKDCLIQILGSAVFDHLKYIEFCDESTKRKIEMYLPKADAPASCGFSSPNKSIVVVNKRPIRLKAVDKILKDFYNESTKNSGRARYPICYVSFTLPSVEVDVNIEPNKTSVMLHDAENILAQFSHLLKGFYKCEEINENSVQPQNPLPEDSSLTEKQKPNSEGFLDSFKKACDTSTQSLSLETNDTNLNENSSLQNLNLLNYVNTTQSLSPSPNTVKHSKLSLKSNLQSQKNVHPAYQSQSSMSKNDICKVKDIKEPSKKKQKTSSQKISKDFEQHLSTLNSYFGSSNNENSSSNSLVEMSAVTVERLKSSQNVLQVRQDIPVNSAEQSKITSFTVVKDLSDNSALSSVNPKSIDFNLYKVAPVEGIDTDRNITFTTNKDIENRQNKSSTICQENNAFAPNQRSNSVAFNKHNFHDSGIEQNSISSFTAENDLSGDSTALSSVDQEKMDFDINFSSVANINKNRVIAITKNKNGENNQSESPALHQEKNVLIQNQRPDSIQNEPNFTDELERIKNPAVKGAASCSTDKQDISGITIPKLNKSGNSSNISSDPNESGVLWSRGVHTSGDKIEPVAVLQPTTVSTSGSKSKENAAEIYNKKTSPKQKSSCFERKMTAFDFFCRNNRLEVAAQNPEFSNQQIAQLLSEKWSNLTTEEKAIYKNMIDKNYPKEIKKKERLGKTISQNLSLDKKNVVISERIKKKFRAKPKTKSVSYNLQHIKIKFPLKKVVNNFQDLNIMNCIAPGIWMCEESGKLYCLNTFRVQETVIYHRLLETFQFEIEPLEEPTKISHSLLGDEAVAVLNQLKYDSQGIIHNEHLTANGFNIRCVIDENGKTCFQFVGIANCGSFYGVLDLKELLLILKEKRQAIKLSECRPSKVLLYLQGEAHRISRKCTACHRKQDVEDLLAQRDAIKPTPDICIHHKPFFNEIWNLNKSVT